MKWWKVKIWKKKSQMITSSSLLQLQVNIFLLQSLQESYKSTIYNKWNVNII